MKKLMIAAAIVCAAAFANAAGYNWSVAAYATPDGGDSPLNGTFYAFDANAISLSTLAGQLTDSAIGAKALEGALNYVGVDQDSGYVDLSGSGLTGSSDTDPIYAQMYGVLVANGEDGKQYFFGYNGEGFESVLVNDAYKSGTPIQFGNEVMIDTGAVGGAGWTEIAAVPEPTSGLLLLLGVAGLALRRRRA